MPAFLLLVLFEKWYGWRKGKDTVRNMDMISSLSSGVTNVTKDVVGLAFVIISYPYLVRNLAVTHINNTVIVYIIAFFALDLAGYWVHRLQHVANFFWNGHIVHHSSEEFNLACALRQSISSIVKTFAIFLLPAALLGVPAPVIAVVAPLHLFAQFWYHTQHIGKMGFLEKIIVTPSHHRVHHAINPEYIDKNFGQIFIFWDKWLGTFQQEMEEVSPVYGVTRPARTWNPIKINFQHLALLLKDAWHTKEWKDKLRVFYKPTGWRPEDVKQNFPVFSISDVYDFEKYDTVANPFSTFWCWAQMLVLLLLISYLFGNIAAIGSPEMFIYGAFVFLYIYALTDWMDTNKFSWIFEVLKFIFGAGIIFYSGDWFGISGLAVWLPYAVLAYLFISLFVSICLAIKEKSKLLTSSLR